MEIRMKKIAAYCKKNHPGKVQEVLAHADAFCEHVFWFDTENDLEQLDDAVRYGADIKWDYKSGK